MKLWAKFALGGALAVALTGVLLAYGTVRVATDQLRAALRSRGVATAAQLTLSVADDVIADNSVRVHDVIKAFRAEDPDVEYVYVIGLDGEVVAHTFSGGFPLGLVDANVVPVARRDGARELSLGDRPVVDVGRRLLAGTQAEVHVGMGMRSEVAAARVVILQAVALTIAAVLAEILFVVWLSRFVTHPLDRLTEAADRFGAKGGFERLPVEGRDEVAVLTEAFNVMAGRLQESLASVQQALAELEDERSHLEELVDDRTVELQARNAELSEATEAKGRFLANVSHELRTPLNSILGFSGLMLEGMAGEINAEQRKQLTMVNNSGKHLLELIDDILDLSRIEASRMKVSVAPVDIGEVCTQVVGSMRPLADARGLYLRTEGCADQGPLSTDQTKLRQILYNLVGNALKFTVSGGVTLTVEREGPEMVFRVADTGIGIAAGEIEHVFEEFHQVHSRVAGKPAGTGLGLTVSARLAELLGGSIAVESEIGRGSTFTVRLPDMAADEGSVR
ncbi:MAG: ATP-binding protein [Coriobacteriia bacterium]